MAIACVIFDDGPVARQWLRYLPHARLVKPVNTRDDLGAAQRLANTDWVIALEPRFLVLDAAAIQFVRDFDPDTMGFAPNLYIRLSSSGFAGCMRHDFDLDAAPHSGNEVLMASPLRETKAAPKRAEHRDLDTHDFSSQDTRAPYFPFQYGPDHYAWAAGRTVHVLDRGCRFTLRPILGGTGQQEHQDLVKYEDHERLDVFMLTTGSDFSAENWGWLRQGCPRAQLFRTATAIHASLRALAERSTTEHFFVVDADNYVQDFTVFDYLPRDAQVFSTHIWHANNPLGVEAYGHGGIKVFPRYLFLTPDASAGRNRADITLGTNDWIEVHPVVASDHRFNTSPQSIRYTAGKEIRKLAAKARNDAESYRRLQQWVEAGRDEPAILRALQDQANG